jgi:hypothetical protein
MDEQFSTWKDWKWSSRCLALLCSSTRFSNLKWWGERSINWPSQQTSRWAKAAESNTIGWPDAMLFRALVHLVLLTVALHRAWLLTQIIPHFIRQCVGSSGAEGLFTKTLLLANARPSDEPLLHLWFIRCWSCRLGKPLSWFKLSVEWLTVSPLRLSIHPVLLSSASMVASLCDEWLTMLCGLILG